MTKTIVMLMGTSGSGKSYLERNLVNDYPDDFKKVVSITTRPPREGEVHGKDYFFISEDQYNLYKSTGRMVQTTEFADVSYGSTIDEYETKHPYVLLTVTPKSAADFIPVLKKRYPEDDIVVVYFDITEERIRANMKTRGDSDEAIDARLAKDTLAQDFEESGLDADIVISDAALTENLPEKIKLMLDVRKIQINIWDEIDG